MVELPSSATPHETREFAVRRFGAEDDPLMTAVENNWDAMVPEACLIAKSCKNFK